MNNFVLENKEEVFCISYMKTREAWAFLEDYGARNLLEEDARDDRQGGCRVK